MLTNINDIVFDDPKVANYGLGGLYTVHYDQVLMGASVHAMEARKLFNILTGDRITTVMISVFSHLY
jgi:hypothetical protein